MVGAPEKLNFQIILKSGDVEENSTHWQKQCHMLYDFIRKNLPEGSVDPLSCSCEDGEKAGIVFCYDTLALAGITLNSFYIIIKLINLWEKSKKKANIKLKIKNGSEFILSNLSVEEALELYRNLQYEDDEQE